MAEDDLVNEAQPQKRKLVLPEGFGDSLEDVVRGQLQGMGYLVSKNRPPPGLPGLPDFTALMGLNIAFVEVKDRQDEVDVDQAEVMQRLLRTGHEVWLAKADGEEVSYRRCVEADGFLRCDSSRELFRLPRQGKAEASRARLVSLTAEYLDPSRRYPQAGHDL